MAQFYFIVHDAYGSSEDDQGSDLADLASARNTAVAGARSMMSESIKRGEMDLSAYIVIEDEKRAEVDRVIFGEAVSIKT